MKSRPPTAAVWRRSCGTETRPGATPHPLDRFRRNLCYSLPLLIRLHRLVSLPVDHGWRLAPRAEWGRFWLKNSIHFLTPAFASDPVSQACRNPTILACSSFTCPSSISVAFRADHEIALRCHHNGLCRQSAGTHQNPQARINREGEKRHILSESEKRLLRLVHQIPIHPGL